MVSPPLHGWLAGVYLWCPSCGLPSKITHIQVGSDPTPRSMYTVFLGFLHLGVPHLKVSFTFLPYPLIS